MGANRAGTNRAQQSTTTSVVNVNSEEKRFDIPTEVVVSLPEHEKAPGLRDAFTKLANMRVRDVADGWIAFCPAEGTDAPYPYFNAIRLCDATTDIADSTWAPLLESPRYEGEDDFAIDRFPDGDWRAALRRHAEKIHDPNRPETGVAALKTLFLATPRDEVPAFLTAQVPALFDAYPDGSLWFVRADELLNRRFTLLRMLVASSLAPDVFDENQAGREAQVVTLREQSLSRGTDIGHLIDPLLLVFSPATLGFTLQWLPHTVVFLTGHTSSMLRDYPATPWALYDPGLQTPYVSASRYADFIVDVPTGDIESLLQWWVQRLNVVYRRGTSAPRSSPRRIRASWTRGCLPRRPRARRLRSRTSRVSRPTTTVVGSTPKRSSPCTCRARPRPAPIASCARTIVKG